MGAPDDPTLATMKPSRRRGTRLLSGAGFGGEVVGEAEGDELGGEASVGEAGPALQFVFAAQAEGGADSIVRTDASGEEVVGEVGVAEGIVEVTAAEHDFDVGDEGAIGAEGASAE